MKQRPYGHTGKCVSELGFGAWQLGNTKEEQWGDAQQDPIRLVHAALDSGINFFDTAPNYGLGASMECLCKALVGKRDQVVINSKFGHGPEGENFDHGRLKTSVEQALQILKTDYLDSILLHSPTIELCNGASPLYPIFEELVQEGKILAFGASLDTASTIRELVRTSPGNVVMPLFNLNFQDAGETFAEAAAKGYGIVVKVPLDSGWLTGKYTAASRFSDIRNRWSKEEIERRFALQQTLEAMLDRRMSLHEAALSFILAHDEVSTVIPGIKNEAQLASNLKAAEAEMPAELHLQLKRYYREHIQADPLPW